MSAVDTLDELAGRVQRWVAIETMLFETLGAWARSDELPAAARRPLAAWCHRHGWHAELWRDRMPVIPHRDIPADDHGDDGWLSSTRALIETDPAALVDPVLPGVANHLSAHRAAIDPLLDGPTERILQLVAADFDAELAELRPLLGSTGKESDR